MDKCCGCNEEAPEWVRVPTCEACKRILGALILTLNPASLSETGAAELPAARKLTLLKVRQMARELADASVAFADPDFPTSKLAHSMAVVEEMWATLHRGGWAPGKRLTHMVN